MNDTEPWVAARLAALYRERSGGERVAMACRMFDLARTLLIAGIQSREPGIGEAELRRRIFEITYADDLEPSRLSEWAARLRG